MGVVNDEFGGGDYEKDKARILLAFFAFKKLIKASFLTSIAKKAFNFLQHIFTQAFIFQHFNPK